MLNDRTLNLIFRSMEEEFEHPTYGGLDMKTASRLRPEHIDAVQYYWHDRMTQTAKQWRALVRQRVAELGA